MLSTRSQKNWLATAAACALMAATVQSVHARSDGVLTIKAVDADTGQPVAARMHLKRQPGKEVLPPRVPKWKDHFVFDGEIALELNRGQYVFELERGPEYKPYTGHFEIRVGSDDEQTIELHRFVDLAKRGWYSGELHVHRDPKEVELLMRAEDLHVAPVVTWWKSKTRNQTPPANARGLVQFDGNRFTYDLAGEDERDGGALLYINLEKALDLSQAGPEFPPLIRNMREARQQSGVHVDLEKPFWRDCPIVLASGQIDTIGLAHNHLWRDGVLDNEAWGRPRNRSLYPAPHGNGRWAEAIYYHVLNSGLRIPPSAGSASGVLPNPVGYNRVYVYCGQDFTYESWFENLRAGKVVVTNGPLMEVNVEGEPPGHIFTAEKGQELEFEVGLSLSTREPIDYLEIVKDGAPIHSIRLDEFKERKGRLPKVPFTESGWFLVRAVTSNAKTYRFASSGPYYVEYDYGRRISRKSVQFFLDWIDERTRELKIEDEGQLAEVQATHEEAHKFWEGLLKKANAE